uniref:G protein-coupled receptor kinase n=1 Tax=Laticauda laticaudata TaxID=8630 RepID=A0A8C5WVV0_LATLA
MADVEDGDELGISTSHSGPSSGKAGGADKMFSLKKWNAVAMWSWDVECDTCAICRVQVMDACLRCQAENKQEDCVVVWGECNHSFHNCCMSLWVKQNNRCPLCQQDWVCAVQVKCTGKMYACKKLDKKRLKKKKGESMALLEKEILEKVNSRFIVTLAYAFQSKTSLCLVMSLMNGGDLKYHIYNVGERGLERDRVVFYSAQIICGILHLHSIKIVYRDMKPENVLLDDNGHCRLSDLGLAVEVKDGKKITHRAGTNGYMAPEILKEESYSYAVDWFAMGCSIYEMIAGRTPFKDYKEKVEKDEVKKRTINDEAQFQHANFDEPTKEICKLFLAKNPESRLGSRNNDDDPRKHEYFKSINFHRLEAGLIDPPFVPDPSVVYAKDVADIADFSEARGIEFDDKDIEFFKRFSTGAIPIPWQEEVIEMGLFEDLNNPKRLIEGDSKSGICLLL